MKLPRFLAERQARRRANIGPVVDYSGQLSRGPLEITYLCPATNKPIGGIKVIYKHSELLNSLGIKSSVYHPEKSNFSCSWFDHSAVIRSNRPFRKGSDLVVIPEIWAVQYAEHYFRNNIPYAIFVQNGYILGSVTERDISRQKQAYMNASVVLTISDDTTEAVLLAYPALDRSKICRVLPHLEDRFSPGHKTKTIAYMPRKMREHANKVCFYLRQYLPAGWKLVPIERLPESAVVKILAQASIFLSFSDQEGFGLPPLEAALSGALVVGYTGQGGNEYFSEPNFLAVEQGNFRQYVLKILESVKKIDSDFLNSAPFVDGVNKLKSKYSDTCERDSLARFVSKISTI